MSRGAEQLASNVLGTVLHCTSPGYAAISELKNFIHKCKRLLVLSGAGVSTESGIRDYRSVGIGQYAIMKKPILNFQEFQQSEQARKRYWLRNLLSWPKLSEARPNSTHEALVKWERKGYISSLLTQNIDNLHIKAGSRKVVELHGTIYKVRCLNCGDVSDRHDMQKRITELNQTWIAEVDPSKNVELDGDVNVSDKHLEEFQVPKCRCCGGVLKTDVVFFGEMSQKNALEKADAMMEEADAILVMGSSLQVYSGYMYVDAARRSGKKIGIINADQTRADKLASMRIYGNCGDVIKMYDYYVEEAFDSY